MSPLTRFGRDENVVWKHRDGRPGVRLQTGTCAGCLFLVLLLLTSPARSTSYVMIHDDVLADQATLIVVGSVGRVESIVGNPPVTRYSIETEQVLKGKLPRADLSFDVMEGFYPDGKRLFFFGNPAFSAHDRLILFLTTRDDGSYGLLHLSLGAFKERFAGNDRVASRDLADAVEFGTKESDSARFHGPRDFSKFVSWLRDHASGSVREMDYFLDPSLAPRFVSGDFSMINFIARHDAFDMGETVDWVRADVGQNALSDGGDSALNAAFAAWNNDLKSNVRQALTGTTPSNPASGVADGVNNISFDDPGDVIGGTFTCAPGGGGTLARGGFIANNIHVYQHQTYVTIVEMNVVVNDGVECTFTGGPGGAGAIRAEEVYAHEIGHALGLGHSCQTSPFCLDPIEDDALMRPNAHFDGRGARLGTDDRLAIEFLYPNYTEDFPVAIFPQYIDGKIGNVLNKTRVVIRNNGTQADSGSIRFQNALGAPQIVPFSSGETSPAGQASSIPFNIQPGGVFDFETAGTGTNNDLLSGSIEVDSNLQGDSQLEATVVFSVLGNYVSVPSSTLASVHQVFVSVNNTESTGFAVYNPIGGNAAHMDIRLYDSAGVQRAQSDLALDGKERYAIFIDDAQLFKTFLGTVNNVFTGTMTISTQNGELVAILGLLQKAGSGALVSVQTSTNVPQPED